MIDNLLLNCVYKPLHYHFFSRNRSFILASMLSEFIPASVKLTGIDIGCGPGDLVSQLSLLRPDVTFTGVDVMERVPFNIKERFAYQTYDGKRLPFADRSFSFSILVDVLHHSNEPKLLLAEAVRVSEQFVLIKDHVCNSKIDNLLLRLMDWVGNRSYGVNLPYYYFSDKEWNALFDELSLTIEEKINQLKLYNSIVSLIFNPKLHFIVKLQRKSDE